MSSSTATRVDPTAVARGALPAAPSVLADGPTAGPVAGPTNGSIVAPTAGPVAGPTTGSIVAPTAGSTEGAIAGSTEGPVDGRPADAPVVLAVDGNSLVHRSFHAGAGSAYRSPATLAEHGGGSWAVRGLLSQLAAATERACADVVVVGFDDPQASVRRERWPHYKAHRAPKLPGLVAQLALAVEVLRDLGVRVVVPPGLEADDVLASVCAHAPRVGARTVVVTSDRDAFALVDEHTRLLRIINGGVEASPMLDPHRAAMVTGVRPDQYRELAALRGDPSDNLPGVPGVGPKRATLLLREFGSAPAAFAAAREDESRCARIVGPAVARALADPDVHARWLDNCEVMTMRTDVRVDLELGLGAPGRLPLPADVVTRVYGRLDLHVPTGLRALCGIEPRAPQSHDLDRAWQPPPSRGRPRYPALRRASAPHSPDPRAIQDTLF